MSYHKIKDIEAERIKKNNERAVLDEVPGVALSSWVENGSFDKAVESGVVLINGVGLVDAGSDDIVDVMLTVCVVSDDELFKVVSSVLVAAVEVAESDVL